jgi:hypothetical protein
MAAWVVAPTTCAAQEAFTGAGDVNLFTDGGPFSQYRNVKHPVVKGHYAVSHPDKEYARPEKVVSSSLWMARSGGAWPELRPSMGHGAL